MNEKIRELHKQVMRWADTKECSYEVEMPYIPEEYTMKLAELIVRECADIDFRREVGMASDQDYECSQVILRHFGLEE